MDNNRIMNLRFMIVALAIILNMPLATADTAVGTLNISGNVPVIFSLSIRGLPGDLDLTPGVSVTDRLLGIVHFKYNMDIATLALTSDTASGVPENSANVAYDFSGVGFKFKFGACTSVVAAGKANFSIVAAGTSDNLQAAAANQPSTLGYGLEEDCDLLASWGGAAIVAGRIPLADKYSQTVTLTMTSI
jgi:hypothetical protein